jgi:hypothetical protein
MMISPEGYYEVSLKGKAQAEILKEIRSLKREINQLKRYMEEHSLEPEEMFPTGLTRLKCNREYLARAIQAYAEAGGIYKPTKAEQKDQAFNESLQHMKRFVFEYGGYFGGYEMRTYTITDEKVLFDLDHSLRLKPSNLPICEPFTKGEFIERIAELHIGEWKRSYVDLTVLDGIQWSIDIEYEGDHKPVHIEGSNAFPYNFNDLLEFLE